MKHVSNHWLKSRPLKCPTGSITLIAFIAVLCFTLSAPAWAGSPKQTRRQVNQEEGQAQSLEKVRVTIQRKSLQHLFAYGRKFAVNKETVIVGTNGKEVSLKKMLVPCEVVVWYAIEKSERTAKRVDILRVSDDAHWQWTDEKPQ